jgi:hypothetical protein
LTLKELYVEHFTTKDLADQFSKNGEDANGQRGTSAALSGSFRHCPNSGAYFRVGAGWVSVIVLTDGCDEKSRVAGPSIRTELGQNLVLKNQ